MASHIHFKHFFFIITAGTKTGETASNIHPADINKLPTTGNATTVPNKKPDLTAILKAGLSGAKFFLQPKNLYLL